MAGITLIFIGQRDDINGFLNDLLESEGYGTQKTIHGNATITVGRVLVRKALHFPQEVEILLSYGRDVSVGVLASYIHDKWKNRKRGTVSLKVRHKECL